MEDQHVHGDTCNHTHPISKEEVQEALNASLNVLAKQNPLSAEETAAKLKNARRKARNKRKGLVRNAVSFKGPREPARTPRRARVVRRAALRTSAKALLNSQKQST